MHRILLSLLLSASSIVLAMKPDAQDLSEERPLGRAATYAPESGGCVEDIPDDDFPGPYASHHSRPDAASEPESLEASLKAFEDIRHTRHLQKALEMGERLKRSFFEVMTPQQQGKLIRGMVKTHDRAGNVRAADDLICSFVGRLNPAEQCNPEFVLTWLLHADILYRRSQQGAAIAIYQNVAENSKTLYSKAKALIGLGNLLCAERDNIRGVMHFHRAIQADPSQTQQLRGKVMNKKRFVEEELRQLRRSLTPEEDRMLRAFFPDLLRETNSGPQSASKRSREI